MKEAFARKTHTPTVFRTLHLYDRELLVEGVL